MTGQDYLKRAIEVGNRKDKPFNFGAAWAGIDRIVYAMAASEQKFSYEFTDVSLQDLAKKLTRRTISLEHIPLEEK